MTAHSPLHLKTMKRFSIIILRADGSDFQYFQDNTDILDALKSALEDCGEGRVISVAECL